MPSLKTHYFFAQQLLQQDKQRFSFLKGNEDVLYLTTQGPDPFLFFGYAFWRHRKDKQKIREFASQLHSDKDLIIHKFLCFFAYAQGLEKEEKNIALSAIYGELAHYMLDRHFHPYVFYKTGYQEGMDFAAYFYDHGHFESMIDTELERHYKKRIKAARIVACSYRKVAVISHMYAHCLHQLQPTTYLESVEDMYAVEKVLADRFSIKKGLLRLIGLKRNQARALSHYYRKPRGDSTDYLNEKKQSWRYPDSGEVSHASVFDLLKEAQLSFDALSLIFEKFNKESLIEFLSQKNYDGIAYDGRFIYADSVYRT